MTTNDKEYSRQLLQQYSDIFNSMMASLGGNPEDGTSGRLKLPLLNTGSVDLEKISRHQLNYLQKQFELFQSVGHTMLGQTRDPAIHPERGDRRFEDADWSAKPFFSFIKQSYLLNSRLLTDIADSIEFKDETQGQRLKFFLRQYISAVSPGHSMLTNPEVYRKTLESKGENIKDGVKKLFSDINRGSSRNLTLTQTDESGFNVGENLATTPGSVIYQNEIMQLIQYAPATKKVFATPILITPPYINKYYVLDLDEKKSLVHWLVSKGFTVFMISWVNPGPELAHKSFEDYVLQGPIEATGVIKKITNEDKVSLMGYCVGGTLTSIAAALLKAQGNDCIASLTLLTTLLDFSTPGEVGHFISDRSWERLKKKVQTTGYMDGGSVAAGFNLLRENQLFWPYVISNYLKGETPEAFDILYWNSDNTHIPATNYIEYVEHTYRNNRLREPGALVLDDTPVDLSVIDAPVYVLATRSDHIVLWEAAYESMQLLSAPCRFVLADSGHLAGVINPEKGGKYGHRTNADSTLTAKAWFDGAEEQAGSWWPDWFAWAQSHFASSADNMLVAREAGGKASLPILEAAPGSYVLKRA